MKTKATQARRKAVPARPARQAAAIALFQAEGLEAQDRELLAAFTAPGNRQTLAFDQMNNAKAVLAMLRDSGLGCCLDEGEREAAQEMLRGAHATVARAFDTLWAFYRAYLLALSAR